MYFVLPSWFLASTFLSLPLEMHVLLKVRSKLFHFSFEISFNELVSFVDMNFVEKNVNLIIWEESLIVNIHEAGKIEKLFKYLCVKLKGTLHEI